MRNLLLVKLLLNHVMFQTYYSFLNMEHFKSNYSIIYKLLLVVNDLHSLNKEQDYSVDTFEVFFFNSYPALKDKDRTDYEEIFNKIRTLDVSEEMAIELLETHRRQSIATSIGFVALDVAEGKKEFESLLYEIDKANQLKTDIKDNISYVSDDLEVLLASTIKGKGLQFRLKTLRKMFGSLRQGDFGFIFARPEVGKTTMLASEISNFISQTDKPLVWFSNEESGAKIMLRIYQAYFNKTIVEIMGNVPFYKKRFQEETEGRVKIYDNGSIHKGTVEKICEQLQPSLIIFDSIDKLKGWKDDRDDLVYKEIYQWAREMAKTYCPVIGVCHASAGAEGKKYLEMDDVAYAKTAKQGEADWILGLGATHNVGEEYVRYLHAPKNKLMGDEDMMEELRHGKQSVVIKPEHARFEDIIEWEK